jgi:hypothetical protein
VYEGRRGVYREEGGEGCTCRDKRGVLRVRRDVYIEGGGVCI